MGTPAEMQIFRRLWWGIRIGAIFGAAFTLLAFVVFLLGGERPFEAQHTSFDKMVMAYMASGVCAGVIVGALRPVARWKVGAAILGFLAAIPAGIFLRFATGKVGAWSGIDSVVVAIFARSSALPWGSLTEGFFSTPRPRGGQIVIEKVK